MDARCLLGKTTYASTRLVAQASVQLGSHVYVKEVRCGKHTSGKAGGGSQRMLIALRLKTALVDCQMAFRNPDERGCCLQDNGIQKRVDCSFAVSVTVVGISIEIKTRALILFPFFFIL